MAKYLLNITMDEAPHLSKERIEEILDGYPEWERRARRYGIPSMGSGAIYTYPEEMLRVEPFKIPDYWDIACGLDVGVEKTAAVWIVRNPDTKEMYIISEYYLGHQTPVVHAAALKTRGEMPVIFDYSGAAKSGTDLRSVQEIYEEQGIELTNANKSLIPGIQKVSMHFSTLKLRIFSTCSNWFNEYRIYHYKDNRPVRKDNHLMDATRYCIMGYDDVCKPVYMTKDTYKDEWEYLDMKLGSLNKEQGQSEIGGY